MYVDPTKIDVKGGAFKSRRFQLQPPDEWGKYHPDFCGIVRSETAIDAADFVYARRDGMWPFVCSVLLK